MGHHIDDSCWHLFVPKYNCQGIHDTPEDYTGVDLKDPEKRFRAMHPVNHVRSVDLVVTGNKVLKVDRFQISEGSFGDISHCRAFRDNAGQAKNLKNDNLKKHIIENAKNLSHQSALADISNILSTVSTAQFFTPGIQRALRMTRPEIDPAPETMKDKPDTVWELKYYNDGMELTNV